MAEFLREARPTAVNLMHCCDAIIHALQQHQPSGDSHIKLVCDLAAQMLQKEIEMNDAMAKVHNAVLISDFL